KAARMADGTASRLYSGSKESARNTRATSGQATNIRGSHTWGAVSQERQRHMASMASGQVGHRNQGRSRSAASTSCQTGQPTAVVFQSSQFSVQYSLVFLAGIHQARISTVLMAVVSSSHFFWRHRALPGM